MYIGSFIECGTLKEEFIQAKVDTWVSTVGVFTKLAVKYLQAIYTGYYTSCLQVQGKCQYLCQVMPDIAPFWIPVACAAGRVTLYLSGCWFGWHQQQILWAAGTGWRAGRLGIRNPVAMATEFYNTSLNVCSCLVEFLALQEKPNHVTNMAQVAKAQLNIQHIRDIHEGVTLERRGGHKPVENCCRKKSAQWDWHLPHCRPTPPQWWQHPHCRGMVG